MSNQPLRPQPQHSPAPITQAFAITRTAAGWYTATYYRKRLPDDTIELPNTMRIVGRDWINLLSHLYGHSRFQNGVFKTNFLFGKGITLQEINQATGYIAENDMQVPGIISIYEAYTPFQIRTWKTKNPNFNDVPLGSLLLNASLKAINETLEATQNTLWAHGTSALPQAPPDRPPTTYPLNAHDRQVLSRETQQRRTAANAFVMRATKGGTDTYTRRHSSYLDTPTRARRPLTAPLAQRRPATPNILLASGPARPPPVQRRAAIPPPRMLEGNVNRIIAIDRPEQHTWIATSLIKLPDGSINGIEAVSETLIQVLGSLQENENYGPAAARGMVIATRHASGLPAFDLLEVSAQDPQIIWLDEIPEQIMNQAIGEAIHDFTPRGSDLLRLSYHYMQDL